MKEEIHALQETLKMLSVFNLSGDAVDMMAAAKQNIRLVIAKLEKSAADGGDSDESV